MERLILCKEHRHGHRQRGKLGGGDSQPHAVNAPQGGQQEQRGKLEQQGAQKRDESTRHAVPQRGEEGGRIGTMLFTSIYGIVDGLCVSNFVGKTAFAAVNLIMPLPQLLGTVGFMLGTGGSAIVGITLGEGNPKKADRYFTMFLLAALISVSVLAVLGILLLRPVAELLGAKGELLDYAVRYGRILMLALPPFALQNMFQSFFVTAEKPLLGFWFTVGAGCTNMVLDVVMVGMLHWGVEGAAIATLISQLVGGVLPVFYFIDHHNTSRLHLCRTQFYGRVLWDACINGSSELMTNLSMSLVNILYNFQLLRLAGENGVAAYGVIMYAAFLFVAVFVGYAVGSAPIVSFHYGARNHAEVHNLYQKSLRLIAVVAVTMTAVSMVLIPYVARIFGAALAQRDANDGAAAGAQHKADSAQQLRQRHDEVDRRKGRLAHKVGNTQAVHDAVDGGEQHGADAGQHEPQQAGIGKVVGKLDALLRHEHSFQ